MQCLQIYSSMGSKYYILLDFALDFYLSSSSYSNAFRIWRSTEFFPQYLRGSSLNLSRHICCGMVEIYFWISPEFFDDPSGSCSWNYYQISIYLGLLPEFFTEFLQKYLPGFSQRYCIVSRVSRGIPSGDPNKIILKIVQGFLL